MKNNKINGVGIMLNRKAPKIIQINDILEWNRKGELVYSPKYQRNAVWNEKAKGYFIDTILRELPVPPLYLRQTIDVNTRKARREVIDGQQRIRAIIDFSEDKFKISKTYNEELGGKCFSDLNDNIKEHFLEYEICAEIINEKEDSIIYDMFARLNTNNYVLNKQELRNAKFWGDFKVEVYNLAGEYREMFSKNHILTEKKIVRMADAELISNLLQLSLLGICDASVSEINKLYKKYDDDFSIYNNIKEKFKQTMAIIDKIYKKFNNTLTSLSSAARLYTLFAVLYHQMWGLDKYAGKKSEKYNDKTINDSLYDLCNKITDFQNLYNHIVIEKDFDKKTDIYKKMIEFENYHARRTTNKKERELRVDILNEFIVGD